MKNIYVCFPGGKHKVLTLSYDDGRTADRRLVAILNEYGIKGTFHLNSGLMDSGDRVRADEIKELYSGHEVAAHTLTHPTIERCPDEQILQEILEDRKKLEEIVKYPVRGLSYPNGSYNKRIADLLQYTGIEYARTVGSSDSFALPDNWYTWQSSCHHKHNLMALAEEFAGLYKSQYLYLMYVWGHSYEFDDADNWDLIEGFCEYIGKRDDIWYAANIEIVDYLKSFANLKFSADGSFVYNPSASSVWLDIEGEIVEVKGGCYESRY